MRDKYSHYCLDRTGLYFKSVGRLLIRIAGCSSWVCFDAPSANKGGLSSVDQCLSLL